MVRRPFGARLVTPSHGGRRPTAARLPPDSRTTAAPPPRGDIDVAVPRGPDRNPGVGPPAVRRLTSNAGLRYRRSTDMTRIYWFTDPA